MKSKLSLLLVLIIAILFVSSCKKDDNTPKTYNLIVTANPLNSGTVIGGGAYKVGESVNIKATPNSGYLFINWTIGDTEVSKDTSFTYTTTAEDVLLTANFEKKIIVKMGAQSNTTIGAFYSISQDSVYTQDAASTHQDIIDLICFYEHVSPSRLNDITISSPGANITGIYGGTTTDPSLWTTKRLTTFTAPKTAITTAAFDLLKQNDATIADYYDATVTSGNKKAKTLAIDQIYAFKTQDNIYGLFKVINVAQGANGYVEVELKLKK